MVNSVSNIQIQCMKDFWKGVPNSPAIRKLNAKLIKSDVMSLISRIEWEEKQTDIAHEKAVILAERLQAIIDWCDIAIKNPEEFNSHGVRNLTGPVFDAAREALE